MTTTVLHVMGPTCSGKSTILRKMAEKFPDDVGLVEVGKMMRAKYLDPASPHFTPDKFKGQAAPRETQEEAWSMYLDGVRSNIDKRFVLVDGQPRDVPQARGVVEAFLPGGDLEDNRAAFLQVTADHDVRVNRARADRGDDAEAWRLAEARLIDDYRSGYLVLVELARHGITPTVFDTSTFHGEEGVRLIGEECHLIMAISVGALSQLSTVTV